MCTFMFVQFTYMFCATLESTNEAQPNSDYISPKLMHNPPDGPYTCIHSSLYLRSFSPHVPCFLSMQNNNVTRTTKKVTTRVSGMGNALQSYSKIKHDFKPTMWIQLYSHSFSAVQKYEQISCKSVFICQSLIIPVANIHEITTIVHIDLLASNNHSSFSHVLTLYFHLTKCYSIFILVHPILVSLHKHKTQHALWWCWYAGKSSSKWNLHWVMLINISYMLPALWN
jgi:hypothetical protein